jgi:hypothetical protein
LKDPVPTEAPSRAFLPSITRDFHPGMGQAVAERTILRPGEKWADVADRVALGNTSLCKAEADYAGLKAHLRAATILMSGRHLQHGDETQSGKNLELFSNCSTAPTSFLLFYLLLNGAGVGRCYDDDMMMVNWDNAPSVRCVLSDSHADFDFSAHENARDARHKYGNGESVHWFEVPDSREGWGQAIEMLETMSFQKAYRDDLLVLDFSKVRPKGAAIGGMQNRPSSGPVPMMNALHKMGTLKGAGMAKWLQALYVDHYAAEPVLVGGARRAARMSVKIWTDKTVLDFIRVKRPIEFSGLTRQQVQKLRAKGATPFPFLWSSNNSVGVDADFWRRVNLTPDQEGYNFEMTRHAREVHRVATECAYGDGTGEPGFLNLDMLVQKSEGQENLLDGAYVGSKRYKISDQSKIYLAGLAKRAASKKYWTIVNPCVSGDTPILTDQGHVPIQDVIGKPTTIWNGKEWSLVTPFSTGFNPTVRVLLSDGASLRCTPKHDFVIQEGWSGRGNVAKKQAGDLKVGDKLAKFDMPFVSEGVDYGTEREAYSQGFYSGDGNTNSQKSWLYAPKYAVADFLVGSVGDVETFGRKTWKHGPMRAKNWVPTNASSAYALSWLAGLFDADASVSRDAKGGTSIQLTAIDSDFLCEVRLMLSRLGVQAKVVKSKEAGMKMMPDGTGGSKAYFCQDVWRLLLSPHDTYDLVQNGLGTHRINSDGHKPQRSAAQFVKVVGMQTEKPCETFCFTDPKNGTGTFNGVVTGQCGEIPLSVWGGYCVIGSGVPYHAETLEQAEDAFKTIARALVRVNTMDNVYAKETKRTNRIGVGQLGVLEFAWKFFKVGFRDLINPNFTEYEHQAQTYTPFVSPWQVINDMSKVEDVGVRAAAFWECQGQFSRSTMREAFAYSETLGLRRPSTVTMIAPNGTISKLFGMGEGWHLPAMAWYLRWVQFRHDDPLVQQYEDAGYQVRRNLKSYEGTSIVGFPTEPTIASMNLGDKLVLAGEASPAEQYQWLRLGEFFWIEGGSASEFSQGSIARPGEDRHGGQISYTLKFKPEETSYEAFVKTITAKQPSVRACCVMPQTNEEDSAYEYLPEEPLSKADYEKTMRAIRSTLQEDIGREHIECEGGACPVTFKTDDQK